MGTTNILLSVENNTPIQQSAALFTNNEVSTSTNTQQYTWDVTSFSFLYEGAVVIQQKLIGVVSFTTSTAFIETQTFQGICDALNTLGVGVFSTYTSGGSTFITAYTLTYVYGSLDVTNALSLTFNSISNTPVADPYNVAQWNAFFITYSSPFTYVAVVGNTVKLFGAVFLEIDNSKFLNSTSILNVVNYGAISVIDISGFQNSATISFIDNTASLAVVQANAFKNCASLITFSTTSLTSFNSNCFENCISLTTIYLPNISSFGANVFLGITGKNITLTIPASLVANANVVYLQANNTVTLVTT